MKKPLLPALVALICLMTIPLGAVAADNGTFTGSWDNSITLLPQTESFSSFDSTLTLNYSTGEVSYSSTSDFDLSGLSDQQFTTGFSLSNVTMNSTADLDPADRHLDYWLNQATVTIPQNATFIHTFLLQRMANGDYGTGMQLAVAGPLTDGVTLDLSTLFGMEEDDDMDSGYALVTSHGDTEDAYGPSLLQFVSATAGFAGVQFGCVDLDSEVFFTEAKGFEYLEFEFDIVSQALPLDLATTVIFETQAKSVTLDPTLTFDIACFSLYNEISGSDIGDQLTGLEIEGFSITDLKMGHVTVSSYTALGGNVISDLVEDVFDYEDDYQEVFRISKTGNLSLTVDSYFYLNGQGTLFDFALLDGTASFSFTEQFSLGAGTEIGPSTGIEELELSFDYSF